MSQNSNHDLGRVLGLILGQQKCLLNCNPGGLREGEPAAVPPPPPRESEAQVGRPATLERQRGRGAARTEAEEVLGERREGAQVRLQWTKMMTELINRELGKIFLICRIVISNLFMRTIRVD